MDTAGLRKDGKLIDLSLTVSPIEDGSGNAIGASIIARDITDQKSLERYMLRTERLAAMGRISTMLAHEVKNPLQAIRSNLELLLEFQLDADEKENCLRACRHEVDRLIGMTQGMLTFVRVEKRTMQQFSLLKLWEQALSLLSRPLERASIRVESDFPNELPAVIGIADQITQVMVNLVLNAIDIMPDGGILQAIGRVEGDFLAFSLINNGPAIPADNLEHIFDPFFSTKAEGTGLGLFICHNIIQEHGGDLAVENLSEGGVAFKMTLPTIITEK
jgi:signal transduction histidine kinase